ncbi:hypothetical protein ACJ7V3_11005 [Halomonas elongata]|uniref:hypothetical protein n=1 Tax=Halomonas elongata TaxID=2746 RepID=UPI0038D46777
MMLDRLDMLGPFAIVGGLLLVYGFLMVLVVIGLTGHIVEKADRHLSVLTTERDPLIRIVNVSGGRLGWYGCQIVLRKMGLTNHWPLTGRPGRVEAIDKAPKWLKHVLIWIYFGLLFSVCGAFLIIGVGMLIDKYLFS